MTTIQLDKNLSISLIPDPKFEFLMSTSQVASGYGVKPETIRSHKNNHRHELLKDIHFTSVENFNAGRKTSSTFYTKQGVIKLGFFVKSERAIAFREWASKIILSNTEGAPVSIKKLNLPTALKTKHVRLTNADLLQMALDFSEIEPRELRLSLINKYIKSNI